MVGKPFDLGLQRYWLTSSLEFSQPIHGFWDKAVPSKCVKGDNILVVPGAINAVLDAFIISLVSPLELNQKP